MQLDTALPVRPERPVAIVHRVDLERLRHQRRIELHPHRRRVGFAGTHLVTVDHVPRRDVPYHRERILQRREAELQAARRHAVLARERLERQANRLRDRYRLLVEPVPARAAQLEVGREVKRDALVDGILEVRIQLEVEPCVEAPAASVGLERRALHGDRFGMRRPHDGQAQRQRDQQDGREPKGKKVFDRHRF